MYVWWAREPLSNLSSPLLLPDGGILQEEEEALSKYTHTRGGQSVSLNMAASFIKSLLLLLSSSFPSLFCCAQCSPTHTQHTLLLIVQPFGCVCVVAGAGVKLTETPSTCLWLFSPSLPRLFVKHLLQSGGKERFFAPVHHRFPPFRLLSVSSLNIRSRSNRHTRVLSPLYGWQCCSII